MDQQRKSGWKLVRHAFVPVVLEMILSILSASLAMLVFDFVYAFANYETMPMDISGMTEILEQSTDAFLMQYNTELTGITAIVIIPVMLAMFLKDRKKERENPEIPRQKMPLWGYAAVVFISVSLCLGVNNLLLLGNLAELSERSQETLQSFYSAGFGSQILFLGILIPIEEELVFRGLLYGRLREGMDFRAAAFCSALVFGFFHGNMVQIIYGFVLGYLLAFLYERYRSVKAPILAHSVMNLTSVFATRYLMFDWMMEDFPRIAGITVACSAVAAASYVWIQRMAERLKK